MDALHLDFGESFVSGQPVFEKVTTAIGITVRIVLLSGVLQAVGILALGPLLYVARGRFSGRLLHFLCIAGVSIPSFFFASSYLDLFAVKFGFTSVVAAPGWCAICRRRSASPLAALPSFRRCWPGG